MRGGLSAEDCARIRAVRWADRTGRHKGPSVRGFHPSTTRTVRTGRAGLTLIVRPQCSTTAEKPQRRTMRAVRDCIAIYPGRVDNCLVDGERALPQEGGFYGGWITNEVAGP